MSRKGTRTAADGAVVPPLAPTGVEGLDDVLGGGFPRGRMHLVEGDPGSGKTTLGLQFLRHGVSQGEPGLYVSLSETADELRDVARSHGWGDLEGIEVAEIVVTEDDLRPDNQYTVFHPAEVELTETTNKILSAIERVKPRRLVIDSLSELRLLSENLFRFRRQVLALKHYFAGRGITVLMLDDRTFERGELLLHSIVQSVLTLEQLAPEFGAERRRLRVSKMRARRFRGGYHDFVIARGGLRVFPRLVAAEHAAGYAAEPIASGIPELDTLLGGGVDRGTSALLIGPAGSGKSTVTSQFVRAALERGEPAVVLAFDESRETFLRRSDGLNLELRKYVENGLLQVRQIDPGQVSPGEFAQIVRDCVERDGVRIVVIDSLTGYLNAMPEERHLTLQLHELLRYLAQQGVTTFLIVAQTGLVGPIDTSYLADTILLTRHVEIDGEVRKIISVLKKRTGRHERAIRELEMGPGGVAVGEPMTQYSGVFTGVARVLPRSDRTQRSRGRPHA